MPEHSAHVHLLLPPEMRDQLGETAASNFRSVSGEVRALLSEHLKTAEPPPVKQWEGSE